MKGSNKLFLKADFKHIDYLKFLLGQKYYLLFKHKQFCSKNHQLSLKYATKCVTTIIDEKHYILSCGKKSLAFGHPDIPIYKDVENLLSDMITNVESLTNE